MSKVIPLCNFIIMNTLIFLGSRHDCYFDLEIFFNLNFYQVSGVKPCDCKTWLCRGLPLSAFTIKLWVHHWNPGKGGHWSRPKLMNSWRQWREGGCQNFVLFLFFYFFFFFFFFSICQFEFIVFVKAIVTLHYI